MAHRIHIEAETFNSIEEYMSAIQNRETNKAFSAKRYLSSQKHDMVFCGTYSWEEAQEIFKKGYEEGLNLILSDEGGINLHTQRSRIIRKDDFVGQKPHIVNTIMGKPKTMVRRIKHNIPVKTISLSYNNYPIWHVKTSRMIRAGKNFMALVKFLEQNDFRVEVKVCTPLVTRSRKAQWDYEGAMPIVKLKEYKQSLNPLMIAYPLVHPSMIRRHLFRYIETSPYSDMPTMAEAYGLPYVDNFGTERFRDDLMQANLIDNKQSFFIDWSECETATCIDDMLKAMQFTNH